MEVLEIDRTYFVSMVNMQHMMGLTDVLFRKALDQYSMTCKPLVMNGSKLVSCKSASYLLQWAMEQSHSLEPSMQSYFHGLQQYTKKKTKRLLSRSLRIEIAYRQQYACQACGLFPLPPTFEVDHIVEIQDGGRDVADNLQALCVACHRDKTRLNRLSKIPMFQSVSMSPSLKPPTSLNNEPALFPNPLPKQVFSKYFCKHNNGV
jgi:hypothetical protein